MPPEQIFKKVKFGGWWYKFVVQFFYHYILWYTIQNIKILLQHLPALGTVCGFPQYHSKLVKTQVSIIKIE